MPETMPETPLPDARAPRRWPLLVAVGGGGLALAITVWLYLGNAAPAGACPAQEEKAHAIDAVAVGQLAALNGTGSGRSYADLAFADGAGTPMTLADFSGKSLLVNFWASWCGPCREEMPALDALAGRYNSDDFAVVPINLDIGEDGLVKAKAFLAEGGFAHLPLYADPSFAAFERLKRQAVAVGLPATLLLDPEGCELAVLQGPAEWDSPSGHRVVETLIELRRR